MSNRVGALAVFGTLGVLAVGGCGGGSQPTDTSGDAQGSAATGTKSEPQFKDGGTLKIALTAEPDYLDPARMQSGDTWQALMPMCQGLYKLADEGGLEPQLAVGEPRLAEGGKRATIKLRTGVKFNDGTPFDAKAVKESLLRNHETSILFQVIPLQSVETPAPDTVVLRLEEPYAPLVADLAGPGGMIASPAQLKKLGEDFGTHPICVGPYAFESRKAGDSITLRRSPHYYDQADIHLDGMFFKVMSDDDARGTALRSGDIDVTPDPPDPGGLKSDPNLTVTTKVTTGWEGLYFNIGNANGMGKPPARRENVLATSVEARRAVELAIDRDALIALDGGPAEGTRPSCSVISIASPYYDDPPCPTKADPEAAKQMLADAGITTPIEAKMLVATKPDEVRLGQAVQAMAREVGINLNIETCDVASCVKQMVAGDFDVSLGGFDGYPDPDVSLSPFLATNGGFNFVGVSDPELDRLLAQARAEGDEGQRKALYKQTMDLVREQAPLIVFSDPAFSVASRKDVAGYGVPPTDLVDYTSVGFTRR